MTDKELTSESKALLSNAKTRSKVKGFKYNLSISFLKKLYREQKGACSLTHIHFFGESKPEWRRRPYAMSLDRINRSKGYTKNNVRLVCAAVNMALFTWGDEIFDTIVQQRCKVLNEKV